MRWLDKIKIKRKIASVEHDLYMYCDGCSVYYIEIAPGLTYHYMFSRSIFESTERKIKLNSKVIYDGVLALGFDEYVDTENLKVLYSLLKTKSDELWKNYKSKRNSINDEFKSIK